MSSIPGAKPGESSDNEQSQENQTNETENRNSEGASAAGDVKEVQDSAGTHLEGDPHTGRSVSHETRDTGDEVENADKASLNDEFILNTTIDPTNGGKNAVNLDDAAATQELHKRGVQAAIGEGHEVDPRTGPTEGFLLVESRDGVKAVRVGETFLAGFLHNPNTDDKYYRRTHLKSLVDGTMVRRGLSQEYWKEHSADRAPKAVRTQNGYRLMEGAGDVHDEDLYG